VRRWQQLELMISAQFYLQAWSAASTWCLWSLLGSNYFRRPKENFDQSYSYCSRGSLVILRRSRSLEAACSRGSMSHTIVKREALPAAGACASCAVLFASAQRCQWLVLVVAAWCSSPPAIEIEHGTPMVFSPKWLEGLQPLLTSGARRLPIDFTRLRTLSGVGELQPATLPQQFRFAVSERLWRCPVWGFCV
jgi:hypothetical protein